MSKREVPLFPDTALLARERGARSSRERPAVTLLMNLRVGGRRLRPDTPADGHLPTSDRLQYEKEPYGSFLFCYP